MNNIAAGVDRGHGRLLARGLTVVSLVGIALVHLVQIPDVWPRNPALGVMFSLLVLVATVFAAALVHVDAPWLWHGGALIAFVPIAGYVLTRSVSVPFDTDDVGNWLEPLGLVALYIELAVLVLDGYTLRVWP